MRQVDDLNRWMAERRARTDLIAELSEQPKSIRRKARTEEDHRLLERAALDAIAKRQAEGRLVRLGPRRYAVRPARRG